jgi:hypothetical protein
MVSLLSVSRGISNFAFAQPLGQRRECVGDITAHQLPHQSESEGHVNKPPASGGELMRFKAVENTNYSIELGKFNGFSSRFQG